jgi:hypothetical protein
MNEKRGKGVAAMLHHQRIIENNIPIICCKPKHLNAT